MRLVLTAAALALPATVAACGESEAAFRDAYRTRSVESCTNGAGAAAARAPGLDVRRMCECTVDRYMAETPIDRLRAEESQTTAPPAAQRAAQQCLMEQMGAAAKG